MARSDDLHSLLDACKSVLAAPAPLTDAQAHALISEFPFERLFRYWAVLRAVSSAPFRAYVTFPIWSFRRALADTSDKDVVALVSSALGRVMATELGASMLPAAMPYLEAASASPLAALRCLAANQYGNLLRRQHAQQAALAGVTGSGDDVSAACLQLVRLLADDDVAVATAAAESMRSYGSCGLSAVRCLLQLGSPAAGALAAAAEADLSGTVRLRVLALALQLAAAMDEPRDSAPNGQCTPHEADAGSGAAAEYDERLQLLRESGLLRPLLRQLEEPADALACLAALQLLEELLAGSGSGGGGAQGMAIALAGLALPQLLRLVSEPLLADAAMPLVAGIVRRSLPDALPASALAAALGGGPEQPDAPTHSAAGLQPDRDQSTARQRTAALPATLVFGPGLQAAPVLLEAVRSVLDEAGDASAGAEACGLDAVGTLGQTRAGAQLVLADGQVARVCWATRLQAGHLEEGGLRVTVGGPRNPCEEALRRGIFGATGNRRPGDVLLGLLQQPFQELRLAAYRCIAALALRSWFAVEVVNVAELFDHVTSATSENGAAACSWRHAAASALWAAVTAAVNGQVAAAGEDAYATTLSLPAVVDRVRMAVQGGPYGAGGAPAAAAGADAATRGQHLVATRGGAN
ncbi:hypothetical protein TSOC_004841 [Tetrabaena socialis]|uniref:Uncharacterized protein n=1 Tax=Tetrabaena socialis TaxID=47790 RepID=A0A2J8A7V5_9CHLO|nr:hypothetical protein TSOC_004841 [Tetrabaena socialis]|eukprot:PNH08585.1 hypothetical protein TSOC_004841 [Tetrabaena socialis]